MPPLSTWCCQGLWDTSSCATSTPGLHWDKPKSSRADSGANPCVWLTCSEVKVAQSCPTLCDPHGLYSPWNTLGQNTEVGSLSLLQGIFSSLGLNPGLPHSRWILYQLSHKGSTRILEWVTYPFSSGSFRPRNWTWVSWIAGGFFTNWAIKEAQTLL